MNSRLDHDARRLQRSARWTLLLMALAAPIVIFGAREALRSTSNDPRQWLPISFDETDTYDWFQGHFGSDEIAIVSWPGCKVADPRVDQLADSLVASAFYDRAVTSSRVISELTREPISLPPATALNRLQGILVGPDGRKTCVVLVTSAAGRANRIGAVEEIASLGSLHCGLEADDLKLAGPTVDAAAIDVESRRLLFELAGFSALLSFLVAAMRLRSIRLAVIVLVAAIYSTGISLAVLYFGGNKMNLLMTMLPPLVYVLTISSAVHLANYYRDAARETTPEKAIAIAIAHGALPCVLAAATTAIGLISLVMSKIDPIRLFGVYSAIGVLAGVGVLFLFLPAALRCFPLVEKEGNASGSRATPFNRRAVSTIGRHHTLLTFSCLTLMALGGWGLPYIRSTVKLQDRFLPGSDAIADYHWLEQNIGPMVPLEVIIHFQNDAEQTLLEKMEIVAAVQGRIQSMDESVATMSAANVSPRLPQGSGVRQIVERKLLSRRLMESKPRLIKASFLAEPDDEQLWRITVRANAIGDLDYGLFAEKLRRRIDPLLKESGARGTFTGVIPLIYKAQRQLLKDLVRSFLAAFAVIAVVLLIVLRSIAATALAMIPNLFPAVVVFGGMEWIQVPVQIGSVMTASAALGIAVDDTVHFLTWFRRGLDSGLPRMAALHDAFQRCAGAMAHTTLICASGLLVFAVSSFVPILHFAWLMALLLASALVGDLILLPSILAGPLGRCFERAGSWQRTA